MALNFIPMSLDEARRQGVSSFDVILVTADAYVDHPSFGAAIIGRFLQSLGLSVGIISQPDWKSSADFKKLGRPRFFFGVTAGNLDSMVALFTAGRKVRSEDAYSEGGLAGRRPYLPTIVYSQRLKESFPDVPVVLGGVEASLRRICHYDYYHDKLRPSILLDAKADLLVYGNAEASLAEIVGELKTGKQIRGLRDIRGTVVPLGRLDFESSTFAQFAKDAVRLPSYEAIQADKRLFMDMTRLTLENMNPFNARPMLQETAGRGVLVNPPSLPLASGELDRVYELSFMRRPHPSYKNGIPAVRTVESSFVSHRGCFGGCAFCSLYFHQGKFIQSRSADSVLREIRGFLDDRSSGTKKARAAIITDIGGPTANMYGLRCLDEEIMKKCRRRSCLYPAICNNLLTSHSSYRNLLKAAASLPGVKAVYVNSGVRFDLALADPGFIRDLSRNHTQGRLSVAPEHAVPKILKLMGKPDIAVFDRFVAEFHSRSGEAGKEQFVTPYFIIGHPGADDATERSLADYVSRKKIRADQVQEFYPTPMALSTAMYYTGLSLDGNPLPVERGTSVRKKWKDWVQAKKDFQARRYPDARRPRGPGRR